jgi:hypothetical protein
LTVVDSSAAAEPASTNSRSLRISATDLRRGAYQDLLANRPQFRPGQQQPALVDGDLALTSTRLASGGATAEVARRQPDGSWLWAIDQPNVLG